MISLSISAARVPARCPQMISPFVYGFTMSLMTSPAAFQAWQTPASALHTRTCFLIPEAQGSAPCPSTIKRGYRTPGVLGFSLWGFPSFVFDLRACTPEREKETVHPLHSYEFAWQSLCTWMLLGAQPIIKKLFQGNIHFLIVAFLAICHEFFGRSLFGFWRTFFTKSIIVGLMVARTQLLFVDLNLQKPAAQSERPNLPAVCFACSNRRWPEDAS